jgi:acid phosphatase
MPSVIERQHAVLRFVASNLNKGNPQMRLPQAIPAAAAAFGMLMSGPAADAASVQPYKHIVVIYQENHSFDNLYGTWGKVGHDTLNGLSNADAAHTVQVRQDNMTAYQCLLQNDVNLTSPNPLPTTCVDTTGATAFNSHFGNAPFDIDDYIAATDTTCPAPGVFAPNGVAKGAGLPGGCTKDIVHRFYSEKYQINGGAQNRYVTGSDASGLTMGVYDSTKLPIYAYLHSAGAPNYVIADNFFQGAFGGSFLNHQWFIAAASPVFANALNDGSANDLHSVVDANGMATSTPLYTSPLGGAAKDLQLTASCNPPAGRPATPAGVACGDYAINTIQPFYWPFSPGTAVAKRLPPLTNPTIGDRLSAKGVDWAWYSGGWSNANGLVGAPGWTNGNGPTCTDPNANTSVGYPLCPDKNFQYHHQAFNYFANFAPGTQARVDHLKDEAEFFAAAHNGTLKPVSFIKAVGEDNEHPGYTSESGGSNHLVDLIQAVVNGPNAKDTLIVVTYDEFGGAWDHVPVPTVDQWGPGTRLPTFLVSAKFEQSGVDHVMHDTTSILKLIEERFEFAPLGDRDAKANDLRNAFDFTTKKRG